MARKLVLSIAAAASVWLGLATAASASAPIQLVLSQGAAFSILGHSCGGIQEKVYASGFVGRMAFRRATSTCRRAAAAAGAAAATK
jgi:hypothetical protein